MKNCQETKKKKVNKIRIKERLQMVALLCCASLATGISPVFADRSATLQTVLLLESNRVLWAS